MTEESEKGKLKRKKLWWEVWLDRLKVVSLVGVMGAGATVTYKAWDAAELFKSAHAQVAKSKADIVEVKETVAKLDAGLTDELKAIRAEMKADKKEMQDKLDKYKSESDATMQKMYDLQVQTLKEIKKL